MYGLVFTHSGLRCEYFQNFSPQVLSSTLMTWPEFLMLLIEVLKTLIRHNLLLKRGKCAFGVRELNTPRHVVSRDGIWSATERIDAVRAVPFKCQVSGRPYKLLRRWMTTLTITLVTKSITLIVTWVVFFSRWSGAYKSERNGPSHLSSQEKRLKGSKANGFWSIDVTVHF